MLQMYNKGKKVNEMSNAKSDSSNGSDDNEWSDGLHTLDAIHQLTKPKNRTDIIWTTLRVVGQPLKMEVYTGSAYSVMCKRKCSRSMNFSLPQ